MNVDEIPSENLLNALQDVETNIVKITESIQRLRNAQNQLHSNKNRTPDEEEKLMQIEEALERDRHELDKNFDLVSQLVTRVQEQTIRMINHDGFSYIQETVKELMSPNNDNLNKNALCDSSAEFHKVLILNREDEKETPPQIMVMEPTMTDSENFQTISQSCCSFTQSDTTFDSACCHQSSEICINEIHSEPSCTDFLKQEVCELKKCLQNIVDENQELRTKLTSAAQRNELLAETLEQPAPFKNGEVGGVRFPGKKEMEQKLSIMKLLIIHMNNEIKELQMAKLRLKVAKDFIDQYNYTAIICQCDNPSSKINIDTRIKVTNQQIEQIGKQLKQKCDECNKVINDYESTIENNKKTISENEKLILAIEELRKKIEEYKCFYDEEIMEDLNNTNEEIEAMELLIKERTNEINENDEKIKEVEDETKKIIEKIEKLEASMKNLVKEFNETYKNLEDVYQGQLEELLALPVILTATHIKLQEEFDVTVLAEETRDKLQREVIEAESKRRPIMKEIDPETLERLVAENMTIEMRITSLEENIKSAKEKLDKETEALDAANKRVKDAVAESNRHIRAYEKYSTIRKSGLVDDVCRVKELLMELRSQECEDTKHKNKVVDELNEKIESINDYVENCKLELQDLMEKPKC